MSNTAHVSVDKLLFDDVISEATGTDFIERRWLAELVENHLNDPGCRFVLLLGGPGTGKTSFVSWMTQRHSLSPRYFIRKHSVGTFVGGDTRSVLLRIGYQLAVLVPEIMGRPLAVEASQHIGEVAVSGRIVGIRIGLLQSSPFRQTALQVDQQVDKVEGTIVGVQIDRVIADPRIGDLGNLQYLALLDPAIELANRHPDARIVVLIDALDELRHLTGFSTGGEDILDWLAQCPELPGNIRVVITSRPEERLRSLRVRQRTWLREETVTHAVDRVISDLQAYATKVLADQVIAPALVRRSVSGARLARSVAERADGNFLYAVLWGQGLRRAIAESDEQRFTAMTDFTGLPAGLPGIYEYFLVLVHEAVRRRVGFGWEIYWRQVYRPMLSILAVAQAPLTVRQLARLSGFLLDDPRLPAALGELTEFLTRESNTIRLCHTSLGEYLTELTAEDERPPWYVDPFESHFDIARRLVTAFGDRWEICDDEYALVYTARHAVLAIQAAGTDAECSDAVDLAVSLLSDPSYAVAKAARSDTEEVLLDYVAAHGALELHAPDRIDELVHGLVATVARRAADTDESLPDALHAVLGYHAQGNRLNGAVLAYLTDATVVGEFIRDPRKRTLTTLGFAHGHATRLRRLGDEESLQQARAILDRAITTVTELATDSGDAVVAKTMSSICYDLAYLDFLNGSLDVANDWFQRSVDAAIQAGNRTSAYISQLVAYRMNLFAGVLPPAEFHDAVHRAMAYFTEEASDTHAERWIMNVHSYLLDLAAETGDAELSRTQVEKLEEQGWYERLGRNDLLSLARARGALVRGDWEQATTLYAEQVSGELTGMPSAREELARDLLDYGRALAALGRLDEARHVWEQGLRCPDYAANWPWKPKIAQELAALQSPPDSEGQSPREA